MSVELHPTLTMSTPKSIALLTSLIFENPGIEWIDNLLFFNIDLASEKNSLSFTFDLPIDNDDAPSPFPWPTSTTSMPIFSQKLQYSVIIFLSI